MALPSLSNSIHALLAESDLIKGNADLQSGYFYPRSPCGERLVHIAQDPSPGRISIHALLAESDPCWRNGKSTKPPFLSTLSLRRATVKSFMRNGFFLISIHALLAESDDVACGYWHKLHHFYPRSPCGERRAGRGHVAGRHQISIHALLAESDSKSAQNSGALLRI